MLFTVWSASIILERAGYQHHGSIINCNMYNYRFSTGKIEFNWHVKIPDVGKFSTVARWPVIPPARRS